jgi:hypothetical protein
LIFGEVVVAGKWWLPSSEQFTIVGVMMIGEIYVVLRLEM